MEDADLTPANPNICEGCIYGRQTKLPFGRSNTERELMILVHSDILGPIRVPSIISSRYVLIFIKDTSHFPKSYYLKTKEGSTVLEKFKKYKVWAENITGKKIKILRIDGGGEYMNKAFIQYLEEQSIEHQRTVPYTPQQNRVAERFNRTAMEKVRSILHGANLPLKLWVEVFDTVRYLYILGPVRAVTENKTLEAIFYNFGHNRRTVISYLKIIGCTTYIHISNQLRSKLDVKFKKGIL